MSRHAGSVPTLRATQRSDLRALQAALSRADWCTPCNNDKRWISEDRLDQEQAARLCTGCPVIIACREYIDRYPREQGVYAGTTYAERNTK